MSEFDFDAPPDPAEPEAKAVAAGPSMEYSAPNGDKWRIELGSDLVFDFEIGNGKLAASELTKWHQAMCGQEPAWTIICRLYGNAPLYGVEDPDELRVWTIAELAEKRAVEPREIDSYLQGSRTYWKRWQLQEESGAKQSIRSRPAPDDETKDQLLREHGFGEIVNEDERNYLAIRIQELMPYLENDSLRSAARNLIQQEVTMFHILDPTIRELRNEIHRKLAAKSTVEKENSQLLNLMKERRDAQEAHEKSMKAIGLADAQGGALRKKFAFNDSISTMVKGYQEYFSENDREIIDGVYTAAEVELLTTPTDVRAAQYRPDLVVAIEEAKKHLWEKDWSPTPLSRRVCRKLKSGFAAGIAEARSLEGETIGDELGDEDEPAQSQPEMAPISGADALKNATPIVPRVSSDEAIAMG